MNTAVVNDTKRARLIQLWAESLDRAVNGQSMMNYEAIYDGFEEMGIDPDNIEPRDNVLTYNAWRAKGRQVKRGAHGVKITVFVPTLIKGENGAPDRHGKYVRSVAVFHKSQTERAK